MLPLPLPPPHPTSSSCSPSSCRWTSPTSRRSRSCLYSGSATPRRPPTCCPAPWRAWVGGERARRVMEALSAEADEVKAMTAACEVMKNLKGGEAVEYTVPDVGCLRLRALLADAMGEYDVRRGEECVRKLEEGVEGGGGVRGESERAKRKRRRTERHLDLSNAPRHTTGPVLLRCRLRPEGRRSESSGGACTADKRGVVREGYWGCHRGGEVMSWCCGNSCGEGAEWEAYQRMGGCDRDELNGVRGRSGRLIRGWGGCDRDERMA